MPNALRKLLALKDLPTEMGGSPMAGVRGDRIRMSPQFRDGKFRNSVPGSTLPQGGAKILRDALRSDPRRRPTAPMPVVSAPARPGPTGCTSPGTGTPAR